MDAFSYTDIFDTKGIEYLVVIGFLLVVVPIWIWLNKPVHAGSGLARTVRGLSEAVLRIPLGLYYNRNHTWAFLEKNGTAKIGLDDMLLHMTGGVSVDFLKKEGEKVSRGEPVAKITSEGRELKIASPVSGQISRLNEEVAAQSGLVNTDPYGKGWLYRLKPAQWKEEVQDCRLDKDAVEWTKQELVRCKDFLVNASASAASGDPQMVLQAGGELTDFPLAEMPPEVWIKFQQEFLD